MEKVRGFEKISFRQFEEDFGNLSEDKILKEEYQQIKLPRRATSLSAGYDIFTTRDICLEPGDMKSFPTGIKVYMQDDEWFSIRVRSGHGFKYNLRLKNQVGVIDADYYNNGDNEGHVFIALQNEGSKTWSIKKGEAFAQGIFHKYLLADEDKPVKEIRQGGLGSTNR